MTGTFTKNTINTFFTRILQLIFGMVLAAIIARVLGPEGKGIYYMAILLSSFLIIFTDIGIGTSSVHFLGKKKYFPKEIFGSNIILSILTSIVAVLIGFVIILFFHQEIFPGINKEYLYLSLFLIPLSLFFNYTISVLLGLQKIDKYNFVVIIKDVINLVLVVILLLGLNFGIKAAIIAATVASFTTDILLYFLVKKEIGGICFSLNKNILKNFFSFGSKIYFSNIVGLLHYRIDIFLLNIYLNPAAVGLYSVAVVLSERVWIISQSVSVVIFPKISSETDKNELKRFTPIVCRNVLFITSVLAIFLFIFSHWLIILIFSIEFLEAVIPFQILIIGSIAFSAGRIISSDLAGRGKPIIDNYIGLFSTVLNIIFNIILIPKIGIVGAAWASSITYIFGSLLELFAYSKISGNRLKDILFIKKTDIRLYKDLIIMLKEKYFRL